MKALVVHCKKLPYDVYIGRPSEWENPFSHFLKRAAEFQVATRDEAILRYEQWLLSQPDLVARARRELRGKVLGCWCKPLACHGDILTRIANGPLRPNRAATRAVDSAVDRLRRAAESRRGRPV